MPVTDRDQYMKEWSEQHRKCPACSWWPKVEAGVLAFHHRIIAIDPDRPGYQTSEPCPGSGKEPEPTSAEPVPFEVSELARFVFRPKNLDVNDHEAVQELAHDI